MIKDAKRIVKRILRDYPNTYNMVSQCYAAVRKRQLLICKRIFSLVRPSLMIDIGGGMSHKRYWRVLDFASAWYSHDMELIDYILDLMSAERLPFKDNSVKLFYSAHTFEHIPDESVEYRFKEVFRCLQLGGGFRLSVPDIDLALAAYANNNDTFFGNSSGNSLPIARKLLRFFATWQSEKADIREIRNNLRQMTKIEFLDFYSKGIDPQTQREFTGNHISWFDYAKLRKMLTQAGFRKIYKSTSQGSMFKEMRGEEFDNRPSWSLFIEAIK